VTLSRAVQVGEEPSAGGQLALQANIHMSMFDIHAACQNEDDDNEDEKASHELEQMR
jgi:hypothetical protein